MSGLTFDIDVLKYMTSWSDVMTFMWREEIIKYNIIDTYSLASSISYGIAGDAGTAKVGFKFNIYGVYVNAGAGRGNKAGKSGIKPRPWINKKFYSSIMKIREHFSRECMDLFIREVEDAVK